MLEMLRDLVAHKGHANAALLNAIRQNGTAASDPELWELLHHVLLANRFWLLTVLGLPFVHEDEARSSPSFDALVRRYASSQAQETTWLETATEGDLERILEDSLIPNGQCSVAQAFMQVCLHSHGHRAQCAKLLRRHGGAPPPMDFILWLTSRPTAIF
ncbi:MAG: DinB family protein [bacterium]